MTSTPRETPRTQETLKDRWKWFLYNFRAFHWKRFRVCLLCYWHLRHWPMNDLSEAEWRFQLAGETAHSAFLEGWCRD